MENPHYRVQTQADTQARLHIVCIFKVTLWKECIFHPPLVPSTNSRTVQAFSFRCSPALRGNKFHSNRNPHVPRRKNKNQVFTQAGAAVLGKINWGLLWSNAARRPFSIKHSMLGFLFCKRSPALLIRPSLNLLPHESTGKAARNAKKKKTFSRHSIQRDKRSKTTVYGYKPHLIYAGVCAC